MEAFFRLHDGLTREGPGDRETLDWALAQTAVPPDGAIFDAGCGPGDDIAGLLAHVPQGRVEALDLHPPFAQAAAARFADDPRVGVRAGDMGQIKGPYDLIWCAGALYFLGVEAGLSAWRDALVPGGHVAFSQICWFAANPAAELRAYWDREYADMTDETTICDQVRAAGYQVLGTRPLPDAAWERYYTPMEARIAQLRPGADAALNAVLDEAEAEIALWRQGRQAFGYLQVVARKI